MVARDTRSVECGLEVALPRGDLFGQGLQVTELARERVLQDVPRPLHRDQVGHPRAELLGGERLRDVVLCARAEQPDAQRVVPLGGEHDDGHLVELRTGSELAH